MEIKYLNEVADQYELILFDIWGVLLEDGKLYSGIEQEIESIASQTKIMFLSNAPRPNFIIADNLRQKGLKLADSANIVTSGDITRNIITEQSRQKKIVIFHLGADRNDDLLTSIVHESTQDLEKADILLLSLYRDANENLTEFDSLLQIAAKQPNLLILCANPDLIVPSGNQIRYCSGYFAQKIEQYGGRVVYTGKPQSIIYQEVLKNYPSLQLKKILMVGDSFETDILGANRAGISSSLVLTGNAAKHHAHIINKEAKIRQLAQIARDLAIYPDFITYLMRKN